MANASLDHVGRELPDAPCIVFFSALEWQTLYRAIFKDAYTAARPPTLGAAVIIIGGLGGYLDRKAGGPSGTQVMWRELQGLENMVMIVGIISADGETSRQKSNSP